MTIRRTPSWFGKILTVAVLGVVGSMATGCAIHSQAPIKEVAYDFSDADFYDKDYAPSPNYAGAYQEVEVFLPGEVAQGDAAERDHAQIGQATQTLTFRQPSE